MRKSYLLFLMITLLLTGCTQSNFYTSRDELELHKDEGIVVEKVDDYISSNDEAESKSYSESINQEEKVPLLESVDNVSQVSQGNPIIDDTLKENDELLKQQIEEKKQPLEDVNNVIEQDNLSQEIQYEVIIDENKDVKSNEEMISTIEVEPEQVAEEKIEDILIFYKNKYGDQVDDADEAKGEALLTKIDIDYIMSVLDGGLTEEEETALKSYIHERLTDEEYEEVKDLINKYIHLLNDAS